MGRQTTIYFDGRNNRLVYVGRPADEEYWDEHWAKTLTPETIRKGNRFVVATTKLYLPEGGSVLDAGCGLAHTVFGLQKAGYDAYGVDYAPRTVEIVNRLAPELQVSTADVRAMTQFADSTFDGVWSLGVVEHFFDGYEGILQEMRRVLKPGGYAFVTVPSMSPLRSAKARLGLYPSFNGISDGFYQFALSPASVVQNFKALGFTLVSSTPRGGFKGLKDEIPVLRPVMQSVFDSPNKAARAVKGGIDILFSPLTYHTKLYVFRVASS